MRKPVESAARQENRQLSVEGAWCPRVPARKHTWTLAGAEPPLSLHAHLEPFHNRTSAFTFVSNQFHFTSRARLHRLKARLFSNQGKSKGLLRFFNLTRPQKRSLRKDLFFWSDAFLVPGFVPLVLKHLEKVYFCEDEPLFLTLP